VSYFRDLGAIDLSPCTQNPNDPVCKAIHAPAPDPWAHTATPGTPSTPVTGGVTEQISAGIGKVLGLFGITPATPFVPVVPSFASRFDSGKPLPPLPPRPGAGQGPGLGLVPKIAIVGAIGLVAFMLLRRQPAANPRRRRNPNPRRRRNSATWTVVVKHRDGVRRIPGYKSEQMARFAGQMFGVPFTIERGNPARRRAHKRRR
jgi:hypothetical protein